jgi:hypothetical protein
MMGLQENLGAALKVATQVRFAVPNSSNTGFTSSYVQTATHKVVNAVPKKMLDEMRSTLNNTLPTTPADWLESFAAIRERCYEQRVGNCGELSAIACLLLHQQKVFPVDYVQISDGVTSNPAIPHLVAVIGRALVQGPHAWPADNTPIGLPNTWHADAVICDPWDRVAYAAHEYDHFWAGLRKHSLSPGALTCTLVHQL